MGLIRRAGVVAIFTLGSRILGYSRDAYLTHVFGAGVALDAYLAAMTIPNVLRRLVAEGSLVIAFVPLLSEERSRGGIPAMQAFARAVLGILLPVLLILTALGMLFPDAAIWIFASGFDETRAALGAGLTRIMMPYIFFVSLVALSGGALNTQGVFAPPAAAAMLLNIAIIAFVMSRSASHVPIEAAAFGFTIGGVAQLALQLPFLRRERLLVGPRWEPRHPALVTLMKRMAPALFGVGVYQLNMIVIRQIASYQPAGELTCYYSADRLLEFALGVFAVSISIAALPMLSVHAANRDFEALRATFRRALRATNFVTIPATMGLGVLAVPIVGVLYRHGNFSAADAKLSAELLRIMTFVLVPIGAVRVIVPTYYALGDTKTPVVAATASFLVTLVAGWILGGRFHIHGLTAATALAAVTQVAVLAWLLRRRFRAMGLGRAHKTDGATLDRPADGDRFGLQKHALLCFAASAPPVIAAELALSQRDWLSGRNVSGAFILAVAMALVVACYFAIAWALRVPEVELLVSAVRRKLRRPA